MTKNNNPFDNPDSATDEKKESLHVSDDPGREYPATESPDQGHRRSSGIGSPSTPRRPGVGHRQAPRRESVGKLDQAEPLIPGEILYGQGDVEINAGLEVTTMTVVNGADRPIQVGSHFHFAEVNAALEFDREKSWGKRLNVLSGGSVRFEPGIAVEVELVPIQGRRIVRGLRGLCGGRLDG